MAFKPKSAAETKAAELASAIVRVADSEGAPLQIGVDRLRQGNPRLTPLAIGQMFRRHRDVIEAALSERGYSLVDYADQGPGRGMEFEIGPG
ncbi:adenylosuccinate synthase [Methylobacterium planeticum]|uniref:Adenylosuccinate synthase n=1 Tax=Methylobacterium planeticum TaxID=2615211 RepID=A0A6N6MFZ4_9HYPH|nr:adenylosuccinate synthase [Methylobacterium planeticum]KAB1068742.1 adenylosuccinate synthase [Methylobacterium planeticum]